MKLCAKLMLEVFYNLFLVSLKTGPGSVSLMFIRFTYDLFAMSGSSYCTSSLMSKSNTRVNQETRCRAHDETDGVPLTGTNVVLFEGMRHRRQNCIGHAIMR